MRLNIFLSSLLFFFSLNIAAAPLLNELTHRYESSDMMTGLSHAGSLSEQARFLADQLAQNRDLENLRDSVIAVSSIVDLKDFKSTNYLSLLLAENIVHELQVRGFKVVDFKLMPALQVTPDGDFVMSREVRELRKKYNINYVVTGTIAQHQNGAMVNARMLDMSSAAVVSSAQLSISRQTYLSFQKPVLPRKPQVTFAENPDNPVRKMVSLKGMDACGSNEKCDQTSDHNAAPVEGLKSKYVIGGLSEAFGFNSSALSQSIKLQLDAIIASSKASATKQNYRITGYTDSMGSASFNKILSIKRAREVANYLSNNGLVHEEMLVIGKGESNPVADNAFETGRNKNRRVEIEVY